jgi:hypothetical protein
MDLSAKVVERELFRKKLYEDILQWLIKQLPKLRYKEVCHLLLRYLFNKNITRQQTDDPVFIITKSPMAENQLKKDFEYSKITGIDPNKIIDQIESKFVNSAAQIIDKNIRTDRKVSICKEGILYGNKIYTDISGLGSKYPNSISYALALNIRYTYLKLLNHGLARTFDDMGYTPKDSTEGFASAFNHYFDRYCSAFPDLEQHFGSQGSFFNNNVWLSKEVFINPPFDECLMTCTMNKVYEYLTNSNEYHKFIFTLPNWDNYPELESLKKSKWTTSAIVHKKGELPFIDYMNDKKIIYPCDIAEIVLENLFLIKSDKPEILENTQKEKKDDKETNVKKEEIIHEKIDKKSKIKKKKEIVIIFEDEEE